MPGEHYVYAIMVDGAIRYFGMGSGRRAKVHAKEARSIARRRRAGEQVSTTPFYEKLTDALVAGSDISDAVLVDNLTPGAARAIERILIAAHKETIWNSLRGWDDPDYRAKQAETRADPNYKAQLSAAIKKSTTQAVRAERSARMKRRWSDPGARQVLLDTGRAVRAKSKMGRIVEYVAAHPGASAAEISAEFGVEKIANTMHKLTSSGRLVRTGGKYDGKYFRNNEAEG